MRKSNECEIAYARPGIGDDFGEYSYLYTQCGNWWYSVNRSEIQFGNFHGRKWLLYDEK